MAALGRSAGEAKTRTDDLVAKLRRSVESDAKKVVGRGGEDA